MNKKYLSVILFGALMLGSTGTFTSCKDYDDDITNLQEQITANADAIKALQEKIDAGKWITSISAIEGGFTVTFSDGQTFDIVNGADGAAGANGTEWTIGEDGYWYKDGEKTEYKAAISDETSKVVVPTIKDGYWYLVDEETGELVLTEYKANGAAYAVAEANGGFTIYMPNEDGTEVQEIYVPGAAGSITSMTAQLLNQATKFTVKEFKFDQLTDKNRTYWKSLTGKDATTNQYILASADKIGLRINPVNVDASEIEFSLYNSKNEVLPYVTLLPTEYKEYVTKAAYGNGLYTLAMERTEVKDADALKVLSNLLITTGGNIAYAVSATTACRAEYNIAVAETSATANLEGVNVNKDEFNEGDKYSTTNTSITSTVDSKATNAVTVDVPSDLYDMWLSVEDEDENLFDIVFDQEKHTFVVNADPDVITKSYFDLTITTINNNGVLSETVVRINVSSKIAADPTYDKIPHTIVANKTDKSDANYFTAPMSIMTEALGSQLDAWKKNLTSTTVAFYSDAECTKDEVTEAASGIALTFISADGKTSYTGNNIKNASLMKFYVTNATASTKFVVDKVYYAKVTFSGAQGELNSIVIPFEFNIPALSTMFEQKSAYVVDGVINAYFYETTNPTTAVAFNKYFSKFVNDATVGLVADEKINDKFTNTLFQFSTTKTFDVATIDLINGLSATGAGQNGYGQAVTVNATKDTYEGWKYQAKGANTYSFKIRLMSPIYEGTVVPAEGSTITISANDLVKGALITDADIIGKDYNGNTYTVVPDKVNGDTPAWANPQIDNVSVDQDDDQYIKKVETVAAQTVDGKTVNGGFKLTGESISNTVTVEMPVNVEDAWGYIRTVGVSVTITKN